MSLLLSESKREDLLKVIWGNFKMSLLGEFEVIEDIYRFEIIGVALMLAFELVWLFLLKIVEDALVLPLTLCPRVFIVS